MISNTIFELLPQKLKDISYIGNLPQDIDNCIAIIEDGGNPNVYFHKQYMGQPILKIMVRHLDFDFGYGLVKILKNTFKSYTNTNFDMILITEPLYFGRDDSHRNLWQLTFKTTIKEV